MTLRRAVVTGGAGFIGSHVAEQLLRAGVEVVVIDNFVTGRRSNLENLPTKKLQVIEADLADTPDLATAFAGADAIFHLAALADIVPSIEHPGIYHHANVEGTVAALLAAQAAAVPRFVYAASSSCYGLASEFPTPETAVIDTRYPYALTKWIGEEYTLHWARVFGIGAVALRLFNVYGPRSRTNGTYGAVFGVFLAQKLAGKPYTVVGNGTQVRDFVFVTDVADAFIRAAESDVVGEAINIASGHPQSVNRLVELLGGDVVHIPKRPAEPDRTEADISKARRLLEWAPHTSFEQGVARVLEQVEYWRDAPVWTPDSIAIATRVWHERLGGSAIN